MADKAMDTTLDNLINRINDLKGSIASMIYKIENESDTLNWPTLLDNFALLSGQLVSLSKSISNDKAPALRGYTIFPLLLSPDRDEQLLRITEGRVPVFSHDIAPDYLRTKPVPEVEKKMIQLEHKATNLSYEAVQKQMGAYSKVVSHVWELISKAREEWESSENAGRGAGPGVTSSMNDTHALVSAIALGKGLKVAPTPGPPGPNMVGSPGRAPGPQIPPSQLQQQLGTIGKMPSGIKTNIKAANQMHPYSR